MAIRFEILKSQMHISKNRMGLVSVCLIFFEGWNGILQKAICNSNYYAQIVIITNNKFHNLKYLSVNGLKLTLYNYFSLNINFKLQCKAQKSVTFSFS